MGVDSEIWVWDCVLGLIIGIGVGDRDQNWGLCLGLGIRIGD